MFFITRAKSFCFLCELLMKKTIFTKAKLDEFYFARVCRFLLYGLSVIFSYISLKMLTSGSKSAIIYIII